jgi:hypothetical protein
MKQKHKFQVFTEEKSDDIGAKLEHTHRKLGQETVVSKSSARRATQLLKQRPNKTTVIRALQQHYSASRVNFLVGFYSLSLKVRSIRS